MSHEFLVQLCVEDEVGELLVVLRLNIGVQVDDCLLGFDRLLVSWDELLRLVLRSFSDQSFELRLVDAGYFTLFEAIRLRNISSLLVVDTALLVVSRALQFLHFLLEGGELVCHVAAQFVLTSGHRFYLSHYCLEVRLDSSYVF